jgi:hypothetical protein
LLAQADLEGGGNAEDGRSKSPLPDMQRRERRQYPYCALKSWSRYRNICSIRQNEKNFRVAAARKAQTGSEAGE